MSMYSDQDSNDMAIKLEKILREISNEEDSLVRKKLREKILPLYKDAVSNSNGVYDSKTESSIIREINDDEWTY